MYPSDELFNIVLYKLINCTRIFKIFRPISLEMSSGFKIYIAQIISIYFTWIL
jgi:hypothetical protein